MSTKETIRCELGLVFFWSGDIGTEFLMQTDTLALPALEKGTVDNEID